MGTMPHQPRHVGFVRAATAWLVDLAIYLVLLVAPAAAAVAAVGYSAPIGIGLVVWAVLLPWLLAIVSPRGATVGSLLVAGRFVEPGNARRRGYVGMVRAWYRRTIGVPIDALWAIPTFLPPYGTSIGDGPSYRLVDKGDLDRFTHTPGGGSGPYPTYHEQLYPHAAGQNPPGAPGGPPGVR